MGGLRGRDDPLGYRKEAGRLKHRVLGISPGLDDFFVHQLAEERGVAVVAQTPGVDARRHEGVPQGVHQDQGGEAGGVTEIIGVGPLGQGGAGSGLHRHEAEVGAFKLVRHKGKTEPREVAAAADAADEHVRGFPGQGQLLFGLEPHDGLVEHDVVEDASQGIVGVLVGGGVLHRLGDGHAQTAGGLGVGGQNIAAGLGAVRGGRIDAGPPDVHERPAVGLLVVAHLDHVDGAFHGEKVTGQGQGAAPLAGPGLGGQPFDARRLVVVGLGHRGVGLVAPGGADGFVLIIDAGRGLQGLLQVVGPVQGAGPPQLVDAPDLVGDGNPALRAHFLLD